MATNASNVQGVCHGHQNHAGKGDAVDMLLMSREQVIGHQAQAHRTDRGHQPGGVASEPLPQADHRQGQRQQQEHPVKVLLLEPVQAQERRGRQQQRQSETVHHANGGHDDGSGVDAIETLHWGRLTRWQWACWQRGQRRASYNITTALAARVLATGVLLRWISAVFALIAVGSSGLAFAAGEPERTAGSATGVDCTALRADLDRRIEQERVVDPRYARLDLSPWLRSDRFLADALQRQAISGGDARPVLEAMAAHDKAALSREMGRLSVPVNASSALDSCREHAIEQLLTSAPDGRQRMAAVRVRDAYSRWQRVLGGYALARPLLSQGAQRWRLGEHKLQREQAAPTARVQWRGPATEATPGRIEVARWIAEARARHALDWPLPGAARLERLAMLHAPVLASSSMAQADRIGRLLGVDERPVLDTDTPSSYVEPGLTRIGERVLLQLSYTFWFPERVATGPLDPYAGAIDGLVLRVTLDDDGGPLLWESVHACGCYYTLVLPADAKLRFHNPDPAAREDPLVLIGPAATERLRVFVSPGDHFLRWPQGARDEPVEQGEEIRRYALRPYAELLEPGSTRPPFGSDGILAGTSRLERFFLWPAGIADPGAMRSNGHHATAFLGRRHFDDPELASGMVEWVEAAAP